MGRKEVNTSNITGAIRDIEKKMQGATSPNEHSKLEKEMADLMQKLLLQIRVEK